MKSKFFLFIAAVYFFSSNANAQSRVRLPSPINTPKSVEYAPSVTADGQTLIYQSDQYGIFVSGVKKVPQINSEGKGSVILDEYETTFFGVYEVKKHPSGEWMPPKPIEPINQYANENMTPIMGGPSISYDGNELYFFANFGKNGFGREDIYRSERTKNGWSKPENIGNSINTDGYEGFPSVSPDGKKLFFTREILGKKVNDKQCYRIMVSEKSRLGKWRNPYELPAPINMDCEKAPRILADGKTLVYSSIKNEGRGDFDLYKSEIQADGSWSTPVNLEFINTKKADLFVSVSPCGDLMYMVSDGDIFTSTIPESLRPLKSSTIQGFVKDSLSGEPVRARIVVKNLKDASTYAVFENNPSDGRFTAIVPYGENYELSVNLPEYFTKSVSFTQDKLVDCKVIPLDFKLQKLPTQNEANKVAQSLTNNKNVNETTVNPKVFEEEELVAASPNTQKEQLEALGEKAKGVAVLEKLALIIKIVNKETGLYIRNPQLTLFKNNEQLTTKPEYLGEDILFKLTKGDKINGLIKAEGFQDFSIDLSDINADKKVTVKLAPILPSYLNIALSDIDSGEEIEGKISIFKGNTLVFEQESKQGMLKYNLKQNESLLVKAKVNGYLPIEEPVVVDLPTEGNKIIDLNLKLVREVYSLELTAKDITTADPLPDAVFKVYDTFGNLIAEKAVNAAGVTKIELTKNENLLIKMEAPNYKLAEQAVSNLNPTTLVLFKAVKEIIPEHELQIKIVDRYTGELLNPLLAINNKQPAELPHFIKGVKNEVFSIISSGENIKTEKYQVSLDESLFNRASTELLGEKLAYEFSYKILDAASGQVIPNAELLVVSANVKAKIEKDGIYTLVMLSPNQDYLLSCKKEGYKPYDMKLSAQDLIMARAFEQDVFLEKLPAIKQQEEVVEKLADEKSIPNAISSDGVKTVIQSESFGELTKGKKITLENIYFDQSSPVLRPESYTQLDELVKLLNENPEIRIEIRGHTDNNGDFKANVKLSKERCESVVEYLKEKGGVAGKRLESVGRGPIEPIAPNSSEENRKKNRRVEFVLL